MADTYTPPAVVAQNARRALDVRKGKPPSQRGMTPVGIARATQLANRTPVSLSTIQRMVSYFDRHEVDKQGSTWDEQGKGWQAWMGWGGDEGRTWANRILSAQKGIIVQKSFKAGSRHSSADQQLIATAHDYAKGIMETMVQLGHAVPSPSDTKAVKVLTPEGLSSRQDAIVASLTSIVDAQGKFSMGISESGAHYCAESPWDDEGVTCANCVFYQGGLCQIVEGAIDPEGICKFWVIPEKALVVAALEPMPEDMDMENGDAIPMQYFEDMKAIEDRNTTPKEREAMPAGDFVFPDTRNFPVVTPGDVSAAVSSWGRYKGEETFDTFKQKLIALAKRKGDAFVSALPQAWQDEMTAKSVLDTPLTIEVGDEVKALARRLLGVSQ